MINKIIVTTIFFLFTNNLLTAQIVKSKLTLHSGGGPETKRFIQNAKPYVVKFLFGPGNAVETKSLSPQTRVDCRIITKDENKVVYTGDPLVRADEWFQQVKGDVIKFPEVDWWEGINEPENPTLERMQWYAEFEKERVRLLAQVNGKACLANFSLGVPEINNPKMWPAFYPAIDAAIANGGVLGLHEYACPMQTCFDSTTGEGLLVGRYRKVYNQYLIPDKKVIPLIFTEYGVDGGGACGSSCNCCGWRVNYSWDQYRDMLQWADETLLKKDYYVLGACIFAIEIWGWDSFDINHPDLLNWLNSYVAQGEIIDPFQSFGTVRGTITDGQTTSPVTNATVTLTQATVTKYTFVSGSDGTYSSLVATGTYDMTVTKSGYDTFTRTNVSVSKNLITTQDVSLNPQVSDIDLTAPPVPSLSSPANGTSLNSAVPVFDWSTVTDVNNKSNPVIYELQVDDSSSFSSPEISQSNIYSSQYADSKALANGTYYWRVRARDSAMSPNISSWTSTWNCTINVTAADTTAPPVPVLVSPANGSTNTSTPVLDWLDQYDTNNQSNPAYFQLEVDNDSSFSSPEVAQPDILTSQFVIPTSLVNGMYYWRLRARDNAVVPNQSAWTTPWNFSIISESGIDQTPPPVPTLTNPTSGTKLNTPTVTFTWAGVNDVNNQNNPVAYEIQVDNDVAVNSPEITQTNIYSTQYIPSTDLNNGTYYWHIRARDSAIPSNNSNWSTTWNFTVDISTTGSQDTIPPSAVADLKSSLGVRTYQGGNIVLSWSAPGDDNNIGILTGQYKIQYQTNNGTWSRNDATVTVPIYNTVPGTGLTYQVNNLTQDVTYYFCLWTGDEMGNWSAESNITSFVITPAGTTDTTGKTAKPEEKFVTPTVPVKFGYNADQVKIYDPSGTMAMELNRQNFSTGQIIWNGKDKNSKSLDSGLYIYKIKTTDGKYVYGTVIIAK